MIGKKDVRRPTSAASPMSGKTSSAGFTLLELLLVIVILSAVAFMLTGTVEDNMGQVRYEDTRNRLNSIRFAVLGSSSSAAWEKGIQSGFVVDNGRLPEDIAALVILPNDPNDYDGFGAVDPVYDQGGADEFEFSTAPNPENFRLMKGHRGAYLPGASNDRFRDGWGTRRSAGGDGTMVCPSATARGLGTDESSDEDDVNFGWCVTTYDPAGGTEYESLFVDSFGMDGELDFTADTPYVEYERDMVMSPAVLSDDWRVGVSGAKVRVVNRTGTNIVLSASAGFRAALLVYSNDTAGDGPSWRTVRTAAASVTSLDNGDGLDNALNAWGAAQDFEVTFPATDPIPVGEHLLVLLADDTPDLSSLAGSGWTAPTNVAKRVKFFSRGGVPEMVLEIR